MKFFYKFINLLVVLIVVSCDKQETVDLLPFTKTTVVDSDIYLRSLSTQIIDNKINIVYCDERTQSLKYARLDGNNIQTNYIDKVDTADKNNSCLGYHNYIITNNTEYLVYEEYKSQKNMYFKVINRKFGKDNWTLDVVSINCPSFYSFDYDNNLFIVYPIEHGITFKQYDNGLASVVYNDSSSIKAFDLNVVKSNTPNKFYVYYNENNALCEKTMNITKNDQYTVDCVNTRLVANNVKYYDIFIDGNNNANLIYYKEDKHTMYLAIADNEPVLVGYFANVYAINSIFIDNKVYFIVSTTHITPEKALTYNIDLIYTDKKGTYQESSLVKTDMPISIMKVLSYQGQINIVYGYTDLSISTIDLQIINQL